MNEWLSYSLSDLLLFAPETYWRLFERANADQWPMPLAGLAGGVLVLALALWSTPIAVRLAAGLTGIGMLSVSHGFLWVLFLPINPTLNVVAPVYALGGALLLIFACTGKYLRRERGTFVPALLIFLATVGYPLLALLQGRNLHAAEFTGIAPDPTAIVAMAMALLALQQRTRLALLPLPLTWLTWSALTLYTLDTAAWLVPATAVFIALAAVLPWWRKS